MVLNQAQQNEVANAPLRELPIQAPAIQNMLIIENLSVDRVAQALQHFGILEEDFRTVRETLQLKIAHLMNIPVFTLQNVADLHRGNLGQQFLTMFFNMLPHFQVPQPAPMAAPAAARDQAFAGDALNLLAQNLHQLTLHVQALPDHMAQLARRGATQYAKQPTTPIPV